MGVVFLSLFCYALPCVLSSFEKNRLVEEERAACFAFIVLRMSCCCRCSVTLPRGAVGLSAVCDCGCLRCVIQVFPDHAHLLFLH